ncbi:YidC/Oxa1 family membrane protein insertase [Oceanicoccus sp. KOV_DT_Chl]|uniref:YidC/Oxa1 family membrane protein insertase n=1 Tax=Oceanicoccus sp. KOV_DT_Chl TaxID=1904639 RepID=UPI000C7A71AC|nr:YidC/Oxa1 family membrane protein insertase [Oceanicoccus sp. KOV_DT_Chl]
MYQYTLAPIESVLETIFIILSSITNSYLLGIVLLAIAVRLATKPLEKYASRAVTNQVEIESVLAPQIAAIKLKYKAAQRHEAIQRLYTRYGYHPVFTIRSLAGLGVQLPFFIAAYFMLSDFPQLAGSMVPYIGDLGKPDTLLFGRAHLMPFVMTLVNVIALITAPTFSRKNFIQGLLISLIFLVVLYASPLALLIYWTTSNLFSLVSNFTPAITDKLKPRKAKIEFKKTFIVHVFEEYGYLFFLTNLAILIPLLGVLGDQFNFFTAHSLSSNSIIGILLAIFIIPPLTLSVLRWASKRAGIATSFDFINSFIFLGLFIFYTLNKLGYGYFSSKYEPYILLLLSLVLTASAVVIILRKKLLKNISYLSFIIPLVILHFIFASPASSLFKQPEKSSSSIIEKMNETPVFLLIFDELSGLTLQNSKGLLDEIRYPGFAELAMASDYFPNALTVHPRTAISVPSIASGNLRIQEKGLAPKANLIELFQSKGSIDALSSILPADFISNRYTNKRLLASDLSTLYIHIISHQDWIEEKIGVIPQTWKGFGIFFKDKNKLSTKPHTNPHEKQFIDWMKRVDTAGVSSQFNFLHFEIPHAHYTTTSLGRSIRNSKPILSTLLDHDPFVKNAKLAHLNVVYHNYIQQSAYADSLLHDFIKLLKKKEIFDRSLIIVTADHGVSYNKIGPSRRAPNNKGSWPNIISVPLLIKYPNQNTGKVKPSFVTTLDISSTILKVTGIDSPWKSIGRDLSEINGDFQTPSVEMIPGYNKYFTDIDTLFQKSRDRKRQLFSEESPTHTIAVNYTENPIYNALIDAKVNEKTTSTASNLNAAFDGSLNPEEISHFGTIYDGNTPANDKIIAAVLDGKIQAVFKSGKVREQDGFFAFSLPEKKVLPAEFNVSLFEIERTEDFIFRKMKTKTLQKVLENSFSNRKNKHPYDLERSVINSHGLKDLHAGKNGLEVISIKNKDPYITINAASESAISEPILHIKLKSNQEQSISFYYQTGHMKKFHESQQIHYSIAKGSNSIYIKFPEKDFIGPFRIDMDPTISSVVLIQNIELRY